MRLTMYRAGVKMEKNMQYVELVKESAKTYKEIDSRISSPSDVAAIAEALGMQNRAEEILYVLLLNTKNKVIGVSCCSQGTIDRSLVHPRNIFQVAVIANAASIILIHNHPSGVVTPSADDINSTKRIQECSVLMGIELLDHVIVGRDGYASLKDKGLM